MTARQWWGQRSFRDRLLIVSLVGLAWRLIYVNFEISYRILTDEAWYVTQAQRLFGPHAFTSLFDYALPTAQHGPLISVLLAPVAWVFPGATEGLRFAVPFIGCLTIIGFGMTGRAIAGERVGICAAVLAAVIPDFWVRDGLVVAEPLAVAITILMVFAYIKLVQHRTAKWSVLTGCLAGALALARAEALVLCFAVVLIAMWSMRDNWRVSLRTGALIMLCSTTVVAPWFAFNVGRFERSVLLTNNLGITLAGANCEATYFDGRYIGYDTPLCWDAAQLRARTVSADESVQSAEMAHQGLVYARDHLSRIPVVVSMRELWMLGLYHPSYVVKMSALGGQPRWATWLQALTFWTLWGASMRVLWGIRRRWRDYATQPLPQLMVAFVVFTMLLGAVFVGHWRYRSTLDVALILTLAIALGKFRGLKNP